MAVQKAIPANPYPDGTPTVVREPQDALDLTGVTIYDKSGTATNNSRGAKVFATVTPGTTATLLLAANTGRIRASFVNTGAQIVYLGATSGVTTLTGYPLAVGATLNDDFSSDPWYGIVASGTGEVKVMAVA